jgi:hypothetical protein
MKFVRGTSRLLAIGVLSGTVLAVGAGSAAATEAPSIDAPSSGSALCVGPGALVDVSGSAPAGAAVHVLESGSGVFDTTADVNGSWLGSYDGFAAGSHTLTATADDGTTGVSAESTPVSFTVVQPSTPTLSLSRSVISPTNHDGVADNVDLAATAPVAGTMRFSIRHGADTVRQSVALAVGEGVNRTWRWAGTDTSNSLVASGSYTAVLTWQQPNCDAQELTRTITVDNVAPRPASQTARYATFYPRENDAFIEFKDTDLLRAGGINERASATIQIFPAGSSKVLKQASLGTIAAGNAAAYRWNGRRTDGSYLPAGAYAFRFKLRDAVGNIRYTAKTRVNISSKHLVSRTKDVQKNGTGYSKAFENNACGMDISNSASYWAKGLWLNYCGIYDNDVSIVEYTFGAPAGQYYKSVQPYVYGVSDIAGNNLPVLMSNFRTGGYASAGAGPSAGLHMLTRRNAADFISPAGRSRLDVGFAGAGNYEYDIRYIGVRYVYAVLAA